jgi:hypothetical protein
MAEFQLGHLESARQILQKAKEVIDSQPIEYDGRGSGAWHDVMIAKMGLKEAIVMIEGEGEAEGK